MHLLTTTRKRILPNPDASKWTQQTINTKQLTTLMQSFNTKKQTSLQIVYSQQVSGFHNHVSFYNVGWLALPSTPVAMVGTLSEFSFPYSARYMTSNKLIYVFFCGNSFEIACTSVGSTVYWKLSAIVVDKVFRITLHPAVFLHSCSIIVGRGKGQKVSANICRRYIYYIS